MVGQNPGDKSAELSFRTQDLLEEASREEGNAVEEVQDDDDVDDDDDDAYLSDNMSYDDNDDDDASGSDSMESEEDNQDDIEHGHGEDGDFIMYHGSAADTTAHVSDDYDSIPAEDQSVASEDSTVRDINAAPLREENVQEIMHAPQDYGHEGDAHGILQDLIEMYSTRNQLSFQQYERSLRQLHTKWETILEQAVLDHEHHLHEMELHIDELRRAHENELEECKTAVMEQSQKIILEEMKLNADQEVRAYKSEEAVEAAIEEAVERTRHEMSEDFEIALSGMNKAQEDLKARYEKLVKDTEIRVKDQVETEIKDIYESKMASFNETYEEMKSQLLEQALQIQTLEMNNEHNREAHDAIASLEKQIDVLRKTMDETIVNHAREVEKLQAEYHAEKELLKSTTDSIVCEETIAAAVEKAEKQVRKEMTDEFDIILSGMKRSEEELVTRYRKLVNETELRVRDEVQDDARKSADRQIAVVQEQYDQVKQQVIELAIHVEKLELDVDSKSNEIAYLNESVETSESRLEELRNEVKCKDDQIARLDKELQTKNDMIIQLGSDLEAKSSEFMHTIEAKDQIIFQLRSSSKELESALQSLHLGKDNEIKILQSELESKLLLIENLQAAEREFQHQIDNDTNSNYELVAKCTALENQVKLLESSVRGKDEEHAMLQRTVQTLQLEMAEQNDHMRKEIDQMTKYIEKLDSELKSKNDDIQKSLEKMECIQSKVNHLNDEISSKDKVIAMKEKTIKDLNAVIAAKDIALKAKKDEVASLQKRLKELESDVEKKAAVLEEVEQRIQDISDKHVEDIVALEASIRDKDDLLAKSKLEYDAAVLSAKTETYEMLTSQKDAEMEAMRKKLIDSKQVQYIQEKYNAEIRNLHKSAEDDRNRFEATLKMKIDELKEEHASEVRNINDRQSDELISLKHIIVELKEENASHKNDIQAMQRDHQNAISKLEEEHNQLLAESLKLISQLREEKDALIASSKSVHSGSCSASSSKRSGKRKLISGDCSKSKKNVETPATEQSSQSMYNEKGLVSPLRKVKEGNETSDTPENSSPVKESMQVSPLTMTSPVAKSKIASSRTPSLRSSSRIPKTVDTRKRAAKRGGVDSIQANKSSTPSYPETSGYPSTPVRASTSKTNRRAAQTMPPRLRSLNSSKISSPTASSVKKLRDSSDYPKSPLDPYDKSDMSPPRIAPSDLESIQKRSREGLFTCESPLPPYGEIRLIILNVPLTDRRKKMAKALNIELVNDPTQCTHAIVGDADNHIRRTAKLMAVLCVTPNILRSEWLDDCYKHRLIISPSHHTLLNDHLAEKAYCFSMKQTIKEGNERRQSGRLFNGWYIMFCQGVAGNKAPKESDLRMLVDASGGTWLDSSNVPVPIDEDPSHVVVITSDPATPEQVNDEKAMTAAENGAGFFTTSWFFDCLMHQKLTGIRRGLGRL
mmetsp:Transcript_487/g.832  ORF Transcript_487/g.832 Transcript_487/m.832 type:complete len:1437 (-) Transcript_487:2081-6391(-)|eukprot:CAMPEP_0176499548 /NCGR_PEP_ID=MMETSP0200_2-20121128/12990_1 /TAXON_ID=947934 /ORGANISM="Chaetoceros sp., Strain GSL56" /LENGTH=1436 /DNA_ID=CAMNT_0017897983 /DNA_START=108 /DNA_END=4418 /DNA_ORIENTATION=+